MRNKIFNVLCLKSILGSLESKKNIKIIFKIHIIILKKHKNSLDVQNWARAKPVKRLSHNSYSKIAFELKQSSKIIFKKYKISYNHSKNFRIIINKSNQFFFKDTVN